MGVKIICAAFVVIAFGDNAEAGSVPSPRLPQQWVGDESGVRTRLTRHYPRSKLKEKSSFKSEVPPWY